jgi:FAD/FMN-containing dehydrogenase
MNPPWDALSGAIDGHVHLRGSLAYEPLAPGFNARFDHRQPEAIVRCASPEDVAETIRFVTRHRLEHATRSGGHCFAGHSSTRGVLIDVGDLQAVSISGGTVRVGAGAPLGRLYEQLDSHGVTVVAGSCPEVGIAGFVLGGGLGILGRIHGVASDQLIGAQIVLADSRIIDCDDPQHPDLFWALRGAGVAGYGVVTALDLVTVAAPAATSFHLSWTPSHAAAVVDAWQRWSPSGPDELAASLKITVEGDTDALPSVDVYGTLAGSEGDAEDVLAGLVDLAQADPTAASRRWMTHADTRRFWAQLGEVTHGHAGTPTSRDVPARVRPHLRAKCEFFHRHLPLEAIERLLGVLAMPRSPGESREPDFMPWGGAYNRRHATATAFVHRHEQFLLKHGVVDEAPLVMGAGDSGRRWLDASWASVHRWGSNRAFQNFADPDLPNWLSAYYGPNVPRLSRIKARYDPHDFFRHPQTIPTRAA